MSYQKVTGPLMANSHPGSYCGQDAYSDMLVTDNENIFVSANRRVSGLGAGKCAQGARSQGCYGSYFERGGNGLSEERTAVRRLTPLECSRLQGFPDNWVEIGDWIDENGKTHKDADSPKYKALGNSICTPFWFYLLRRIAAQYERPATLGSLFDGISGFPLVWAMCNGGPQYCLFTSEIEEFPIAVCKKHFGDEETGQEGDFYEAIKRRYKKENV